MAETQVYQNGDVTVTTSKVVVGGNTYFLRNIASIRVLKAPNTLARVLLAIGIVLALIGLASLKSSWFLVLVGAALIFIAVKLGFNIFWLNFDTNAGAVKAYKGPEAVLQEIKTKVEEAMSIRE